MQNNIEIFIDLYHIEMQHYINFMIRWPENPTLLDLFNRKLHASRLLNISQLMLVLIDGKGKIHQILIYYLIAGLIYEYIALHEQPAFPISL